MLQSWNRHTNIAISYVNLCGPTMNKLILVQILMEVHTEQQILSKYSTAVIFGLWDEFTKLSKLKEALEGPSEACSSVFLSCRLGLYQAYCFLCYTGFELLTAA